jgi:hypothetical protein
MCKKYIVTIICDDCVQNVVLKSKLKIEQLRQQLSAMYDIIFDDELIVNETNRYNNVNFMYQCK